MSAAAAATRAPLTPAQRRRAVLAATLGNGLEFYDFVTYAFFAIQIGRAFFPSVSPFLSLMGSLAAFGAGFATRPLGAYVLGGYADRHGRKPAMLISMGMMGGGIVVLALTPGYATIGAAAPVLAVAARLVQGFALGGEVGSATAYMMEGSAARRRGYAISWQGASQQISGTVGSGVGLLLSATLSASRLDAFGWRIALLLGAAIVPLALAIRTSLPETHAPPAPAAPRPPVRPHLRTMLLGAAMIGSGTIATYFFNYMATLGQNTLKLGSGVAFAGQTANNAIGIFAYLAGGALSDRIGRKPVMWVPQALFMALLVPSFAWLNAAPGAVSFVAMNVLLSGISNFGFGAVYAAISESLPPALRARGFALVYSLPVTVFGGTTQLVLTWLLRVTGRPIAVAWYMTAVTGVGLAAMLLMRESAPARTRARARGSRRCRWGRSGGGNPRLTAPRQARHAF